MKTIIYLAISILICLTLASTTRKTSECKKNVILQTTDSNVTSQLLAQSVKVISERLKNYGLQSFDVGIIADKGQIKVQLPDNAELSELEGLLTYKGELAFYETYNRKDIADLLKTSNQLFSLLESDPKVGPTDPKIGCAMPGNLDLVYDFLQLKKPCENCKFLCGKKSEKSLTCLYALKINNAGNPLLIRSDVDTIKASRDKNSQSFMIEIKFKPAKATIWAGATRDNLEKAIAIVIDDTVFYAPVVRNTIENGLCEVSGNLKVKDVDYFLALVNNENLPLSFIIKK